MKEFKTIRTDATSEFTEQKSRFISYAAGVSSAEEAEGFLARVRAEHPQARHVCYAYRLHAPSTEKASDDGEPQGTAGAPILGVLQKEGLEDVCIAVVRYFGGILLGAGGLTRAYAKACADGVTAAGKAVCKPAVRLEIEMPYRFFETVTRLLPEPEQKRFDTAARVVVLLPESEVETMQRAVREACAGQAVIKEIERTYARF